MRTSVVALVALFVLVMTPFVIASNAPEPAAAEPVVSCTDVQIGQQVRIKCQAAGVVVLDTTVNLPVVEIPVPGPTSTQTIRVELPGDTRTVRVPIPGPTQFIPAGPGEVVTVTQAPTQVRVTETAAAGPGDTKTVRSQVTKTARPTAGPTATVTVTEGSRQDGAQGGTIDLDDDDTLIRIPEVELSPPEAAALGLGTLILLAAMVVLGMWFGYYMGYKDSDKAEAKFLKSLLSR